MKVEFGKLDIDFISFNEVFYLYGNYKKTFYLFCNFIIEKYKEKISHPEENISVFFCSINECVKIINSQCSLFDTKVNFFCIKNIEDSHLEKLYELFKVKNNIFILESGDYGKSKKITDTFSKSTEVFAIASFKNDITLMSLCKFILPQISATIYREIIDIINNTDEDLHSLFMKISFLIDGNDASLLKEYTTNKKSFIEDMDFIPLLRYMLRLSIKEKINGKKHNFFNLNLNGKNIIETLLNAEIKYKSSFNLPKSYLYHTCSNFLEK